MKQIANWNGALVELAESTGGVLAFLDPLAGVVRGGVAPWPPPEIGQKLYESRHARAFTGADHDAVCSRLGFYSDFQSMHSEDAITWSVFGPIAYAPASIRAEYCRSLLSLLGVESEGAEVASVALWRRLPHPDTRVPGGPEIDFLIQTPDALLLGEAKWRSGVGRAQGAKRDKDQITLRAEFLSKYGEKFFPGIRHRIVLGVGLAAGSIAPPAVTCEGVVFKELQWAQVCRLGPHPAHGELSAYYEWKLKCSHAV